MRAVKTVYIIALVVSSIMAFHLGKRWVTTSPLFELKKLEVMGNNHLSASDVKNLMNIGSGQNIFTLEMESVRNRILGHPWVKEAEVKRRLPHTIRVAIVERRPAAVLEGKTSALLDNEGVVLEMAESGYPNGLPHISGGVVEGLMPGQSVSGEKTLRALKILNDISSLSFVPERDLLEVDTSKPGMESIRLRGYKPRIITGVDSIDDKLKRFYSIRDHINKQKVTIKTIDLTFKNKVVVQYRQKGGAGRR